jgi:PAS domain S-box-containing protein
MADAEELRKRQQVLANFGELAIRSNDLDEVLTEACRLVGKAVNTDRAKVLEIEEASRTLFVRAGVGWAPDVVGRLRIPMDEHTSETYAIEKGEPVVSQNIHEETRFEIPPFMKEAGVVALVNVPIFVPGQKPFGLLQVDADGPRAFGDDEIDFLRTYAMILGPVIDRLIKVAEMRASEERFRLIVENARDYAIFLADRDDRITDWLPGAEAVFGWTEAEAVGQSGAILFTPEDREAGVDKEEVDTAAREGWAPNVRWHLHKDGRRVFIDGSVTALRHDDQSLRGFLKIGQDVTPRKQAEEVQAVLVAELQHRTRNLLGVVQAVADRTLDTSRDLADFGTRFRARLAALARANSLLSKLPEATRVTFDVLLNGELHAHGVIEDGRLTLDGPSGVRLRSHTLQTLALALHELATNALKHGALAVPTGRLQVAWRLVEGGEQRQLEVIWAESGVRVRQNGRQGYGRELIEKALPYQLGAEVDYVLGKDGVQCRIMLPVSSTEGR